MLHIKGFEQSLRLSCCITLFLYNYPSGLITWLNVIKQISTCSLTLDHGKLELTIKCLFISTESTFRRKVKEENLRRTSPEYKVIKWFSFYCCFIGSKLTALQWRTVLAAFKFDHIYYILPCWREVVEDFYSVSWLNENDFSVAEQNQFTEKCCFLLLSQQRQCFPNSTSQQMNTHAHTGPREECTAAEFLIYNNINWRKWKRRIIVLIVYYSPIFNSACRLWQAAIYIKM